MKLRQVLCRAAASVVLVVSAGAAAKAQNAAVRSRVVDTVDDMQTMKLAGNVHPLAKAAYDQGALPDSQPMTHMMLLLQRSAEQDLSLRQLLDAQLTKNSGSYHAWLTPAQFGKQFGPSDADVQAVTNWLTSRGFQVRQVSAGKTVVEFDGNAGQVRNAFHTEIHRYNVNGETRFANVSDPAIPQALSPVVRGIAALHNFPKHTQAKRVGNFRRNPVTGEVTPLFTYTDAAGPAYAVGPADFAKIYNIPGWPAVGSGQSIAISGQSNINLADVASFQSMFGLPNNPPKVIVNGPDPGLVTGLLGGDEGEQALDVEWAGAVAPQANVILVASQTTDVSAMAGIDLSALYIVDNNVAAVLSESYGVCESGLGTGGNAFYNALWQQAAAEGITVVIAAGDSGSAECDPSSADPNAATQGLAVNGIASTPYNIAVGGTDFDQTSANISTFWLPSTGNGTTTQLSALGYIPEVVWDNSTCASKYLANPVAAPCSTVDTSGNAFDITAGGGGPSNCAIAVSSTTCTGYPKPAFQSALTPADGVRDIPDVSLFSSNGFNMSFYIVCQSDTNVNGVPCNLNTSTTTQPQDEDFVGVGGTSAATPTFAAIIALVNQTQATPQNPAPRQGNGNYVLYGLAAPSQEIYANCNSSSFGPTSVVPSSCTFYDITKGTNTVACDGGSSVTCSNPNAGGFGVLVSGNAAYSSLKPPTGTGENSSVTEGNPGFTAVTGYDLATGLGSVNVGNLLANWHLVSRTATTTTLTGVASGQNFTFQVTVSPAPSTQPNGGEAVVLTASNSSGVLGTIGAGGTNGNNFTLNSSGMFSGTTNLLPPGTTSLVATYGGDATLAMSTSPAVSIAAVTGSSQPSNTILNFASFGSNCPTTGCISKNNQSNVPYGSPYIIEIAVTNSGGTPCVTSTTQTVPNIPCPVGQITLMDGTSMLNDWPKAQNANATNMANLNNQGLAEDQPIQLSVGSHSLSAQFAPLNTIYTASTSNTLGITVTQASTSLLLSPSATTITSGANVTLTAYVTTSSSGAGPTGSVAFTKNGTSIGSATCTPTAGTANLNPPITQINSGTAYCTATLTVAISSVYPPTGDPGTPTIPRVPVIVALLSLLLFVLGLRLIPQTRRRAYTFAGLLAVALLVGVVAGCGGGGGGSGSGAGTRTIGASYAGDTNYTSSTSSVSIVVQ